MISAAQETIQVLKANGVRRIFGNPGTTELPLLDATLSEGMDFHLCLHEGAAVAMADGYARATGEPGVVMVHTSVGTANTLTQLINLRSDARPLLVIAGEKDDRLAGRGGFCEVPDLPGLVRQVCKASWQAARPEKLPELVLRGLKLARATTPGAVFISVPENVLGAPLPAEAVGLHRRVAPEVQALAHPDELAWVARELQAAKRPLLMMGNEVGASASSQVLQALARHLGAAIVGEEVFTTQARESMDEGLYQGPFHPSLDVVRDADLVVAIGARVFMEYSWPEKPYFGPDTRLVQIGADPGELGKLYPTERIVLGRVDQALQTLLTLAMAASARPQWAPPPKKVEGAALPASSAGLPHPQRVLSVLDEGLSDDAVIVDESVLSRHWVLGHLLQRGRRRFLGTSGGGLGWGLPAAMGVQLGLPGQPVVAIVGDGGALFNIQSLWTAANLGIPLVIVVLNNSGYMAVRRGLTQWGGESTRTGRYPGAYIQDPPVDLCQTAQGLGVRAQRVDSAEALAQALPWAFAQRAPVLLDVHVDPGAYF